MRLMISRRLTVCMTLSFGLAACGGGGGSGAKQMPQTYAIGGAVSGLATGESVILANNGTDTLTVNGNSSFTFATKVEQNGSYAVTDGTLSSLNPASVATGTEPVFLAFDPTGKFAYEANYTVDYSAAPGTVSQYSVGTAGQLTPLAPSTVLAGTGPGWVAFDPFGKFAYVVNIGNGTLAGTVSEYAIGTDGALTLIGTAPAGLKALMIATAY